MTFHRLQGIERFWLYDNLSDDDWRSELAPELASGTVTVMNWPDEPGQATAYADCLKRHRGDARWIAFIDIDEFLFSPTGRSLPDVLSDFATRPGVVVNWRTYGVNGHAEPPDGLVIENYVWRGVSEEPQNRFVKSIVYPRKTLGKVIDPHYFCHRGSAVGEDGCPHWGPFRDPPTADVLRINHYFTRSLAELRRKVQRRCVFTGQTGPKPAPPDEVHDETILQYAPALKEALARRSAGSRADVPLAKSGTA